MKKANDFLVDDESDGSLEQDSDSGDEPTETTSTKKTLTKRHKTAPLEIPSTKPVSRFRRVVAGTGRHARDPRFDDMCGQFSERVFAQTYGFLNETRRQEIEALKKGMKKCKSVVAKQTVKESLTHLQESEKADMLHDRLREQKSSWYAAERKSVKQGKKPFFLKKSELKRMELVDKFQRLQETGGITKFIDKRRRKNANKDHRWLPSTV